jgi:hypothetical protein
VWFVVQPTMLQWIETLTKQFIASHDACRVSAFVVLALPGFPADYTCSDVDVTWC